MALEKRYTREFFFIRIVKLRNTMPQQRKNCLNKKKTKYENRNWNFTNMMKNKFQFQKKNKKHNLKEEMEDINEIKSKVESNEKQSARYLLEWFEFIIIFYFILKESSHFFVQANAKAHKYTRTQTRIAMYSASAGWMYSKGDGELK